MLPVKDHDGRLTGQQMVHYCAALVFASLMPVFHGAAGLVYAGGAVLLGLVFLGTTLYFRRACSTASARRVLRASLLYLPALLGLLLLDALLKVSV
jgi:protoheme IX farnesyltransferase